MLSVDERVASMVCINATQIVAKSTLYEVVLQRKEILSNAPIVFVYVTQIVHVFICYAPSQECSF